MKSHIILVLFLCLTTYGFGQLITPAWEEEYQFEAVADQADGGSVSIDITNKGIDINDCIQKAKAQALFTLLFKGYPKTNNASASVALADMSVYSQNIDFFKGYLISNTGGLAYINKAQTNMSKPSSKLDKKTLQSTTTVYVMKTKLREDLEKQGYIKSVGSLSESLGFMPTILIVPSDKWMTSKGFVQKVETDLGTQYLYDYQNAITSNSMATYGSIENFLRNPLSKGFEVKSFSDIMTQIASAKVENIQRKVEESEFDVMARTANAQIWIKVDLVESKISNGTETQYTLTLFGVDPLLARNVINGNPQTIVTSGDNYMRLLETTVNTAIDNFIPEIINYYNVREKNGFEGEIEFRIIEGSEINFSSDLGEGILAEYVDDFVGKNANKSSSIGSSTSTLRSYKVSIPTKRTNPRTGKIEGNDMEKYGRAVVKDLSNNGINGEVRRLGLGKVVIYLTKQ
jgi:hypothetical protein